MAFFDRILSAPPLTLWLLGSVAIYALFSNILWLAHWLWMRRIPHTVTLPGTGSTGTRRAAAAILVVTGRALCQAGTFLFSLGVPYLALGGWPRGPLQGLLTLDDMGLVGLTPHAETWPVSLWLSAVGTGLGLGLVALAILVLAWRDANRPAHGLALRFPSRPWWALLVDVLYLQVHWAFYRAALAVLAGDLYVATFAGLGLVIGEWALNPFWRKGWSQEGRAATQWLRAALALVTAVVFLLTGNLWVCVGAHYMIELAVWFIPTAGRTRTDRRPSSADRTARTAEAHSLGLPERSPGPPDAS